MFGSPLPQEHFSFAEKHFSVPPRLANIFQVVDEQARVLEAYSRLPLQVGRCLFDSESAVNLADSQSGRCSVTVETRWG
jgi:hypothetical protein